MSTRERFPHPCKGLCLSSRERFPHPCKGLSLSSRERFPHPCKGLSLLSRERFPHPYKGCFGLLPNQRGILTIHLPLGPSVLANTCSFLQSMWTPTKSTPFGAQRPYWHTSSCLPLWETASSLAHRPVSGSDTICNDPSPPPADIVFFGLSRSGFLSRL